MSRFAQGSFFTPKILKIKRPHTVVGGGGVKRLKG